MKKRSHPAPYSTDILTVVAGHLPANGVVLDPFAGTGRIHQLATTTRRTIGVEIQPMWAEMHPETIVGNALDLEACGFQSATVDAIATSPTYGNRMADHHKATDESMRLTYTHAHGSPLEPANSGTLQWGDQYRDFHQRAWSEAVRVLRPGGVFVLNIKNHVRRGQVQRVVEWHMMTLLGLGLRLVALDMVPTRGLMSGANSEVRTLCEYVVVFVKEARRG